MEATKQDIVRYRISWAYETLEDAHILATQNRWNSAINRLYYAAYYAVIALLIQNDLYPSTHTGAKSNFNQYFINTGLIETAMGKIYSQLFTWRQKGDYDDLFDFDEKKVMPYFEPVKNLITTIESLIK